jgi:hypothetical protein
MRAGHDIIAAVLLFLASMPAAAYDLKQHQWRQRLLFLVAPSSEETAFAAQQDRVARLSHAVLDRDLLVFQLFIEGGIAGEHELSPNEVRSLRRTLGVEKGDRTLILIGKDGGVKRRAPLETDLREIFLQIDAMPMRRSEMRAKEAAGFKVTPP